LGEGRGARGVWTVRLAVWSTFVFTVLAAGPRAWRIVEHRLQALRRSTPAASLVDLDRVGFVAVPKWLSGDLLTAVSLDLAAVLDRRVGLLDEPESARLLRALAGVPWVRSVRLRRVYPDRFRAELVLRAPVVRLPGETASLAVDAEGACLLCPSGVELPEVCVQRLQPCSPGRVHPDPAVRAAAAVAAEWASAIAVAIPGLPPLRRIDTSNLAYAADVTRLCEVQVALQRTDGGLVWLAYDHPPGSEAPRVPAATKVAILEGLLAAHPGLSGVASADLRFAKRWPDWVELETAPTPPP